MCLNRKVIVGLVLGAVGVLVIDPHVFGRALPILLLAACPLSMVLMMRSMAGATHKGADGPQIPAAGAAPQSEVVGLRAELDQLRSQLDALGHGGGLVRSSPPDDTDEAGRAERDGSDGV